MVAKRPWLDDLKIRIPTKEEEDAKHAALLEKQVLLENECLAEGYERYKEQVEEKKKDGRFSLSDPGRALLRQWIEPLAEHLQEARRTREAGRGRRPLWVAVVRKLEPDVAAFFTIRALINSFFPSKGGADNERPTITQVGIEIGRTVKLQLNDHEMEERAQATIGDGLLDECRKALPGIVTEEKLLYHKTSARNQIKTHHALLPTEETLKLITDLDGRLSILNPKFLPTLVPPLPWKPGNRGGYHGALRGKYPLAKPPQRILKDAWDRFQRRIAKADMPWVYGTVNVLQNVAWRVNQDVYEVADWIFTISSAAVRRGEAKRMPPLARLLVNDVSSEDVEERDVWVKLLTAKRTLGIAEQFFENDFHYPMKLDFRGRVYTVPSDLDPQGSDLARGLLTFSHKHAKPLGQWGRTYLALHGVNMLGTDPKRRINVAALSVNNRTQWVSDNTQAIIDVARNPLVNAWWSEADKPFQFLAFSREFARVIKWGNDHKDDPNCENFLSSFPISVDGSNNGMQHLSAMLRDEEGARAVNLIPSDPAEDLPAEDLYRLVADCVNAECVTRDKAGNRIAKLWLKSGLLDRKLVKRPVMTFSYGVTRHGMVEQLLDVVDERATAVFENDGVSVKKAARFLVNLIWSALEETVRAAAGMRDWLTEMARKVGKDHPISWTAPTGFPVMQEYYEEETRAIDTRFGGLRYQPKLLEPTDVIDANKQATGITPNFVHSLDAAALMFTVCTARHHFYVTAFSMVHDSYGTVPGDMCHLMPTLRRQFAYLYSENDVVEDMNNELQLQYRGTDILPAPPEKGELDLSQLIKSIHFFL